MTKFEKMLNFLQLFKLSLGQNKRSLKKLFATEEKCF